MTKQLQWNELAARQLVRYEALFKLHDEIHNLEDIAAVSQRVATQWKYFANVISWRLVIAANRGFKVIDGFQGRARIEDTRTLSDWDQHHFQQKTPCLLRVNAPTEGPQPPGHLTGKAVSEIEVLPFVRNDCCIGLLSVAEGFDPSSDLNKRFIRLFGRHFVDCIATILLRQESIEALSRQIQEREVLIQEIHHRVKNNMQIISSLLRLQSHKVSSDEMLDIIGKCQMRVDSMSLVHEMLYKSRTLSRVDLKDYVQSIVANVISAQRISFDYITYDLDLVEGFVESSTAVPLGLILTELVSNSLKHAFPAGYNGNIRIALKEEPVAQIPCNRN